MTFVAGDGSNVVRQESVALFPCTMMPIVYFQKKLEDENVKQEAEFEHQTSGTLSHKR